MAISWMLYNILLLVISFIISINKATQGDEQLFKTKECDIAAFSNIFPLSY